MSVREHDILRRNGDDDEVLKFIRSQKRNAQLVYKGYIYNKKLTQANGHTTWRCADILKNKCRAVVISKNNKLLSARRSHNHDTHWEKIGHRPLYDEEDDLDEIIEITTNDPHKFTEVLKNTQVEIHAGEYKVIVPPMNQNKAITLGKLIPITRFMPECGPQLFIISRKGGILLVVNDYVYRSNLKRHGREVNKIYWECIHNRSKKCRSRLKTIGDDLYVTNDVHNHCSDAKRVALAKRGGMLLLERISLIGT